MSDLEGVEDELETVEDETEVIEEVEDRELSHSEDVELSVREAFETLQGSSSEEESKDSPEKEPAKPEQSAEQKPNSLGPKVLGEKTDVIKAPASWTVEAKEWFNQQPLEAKKELARRTADHERQFTKITQELQAERRKYSEIEKAIEPYKQQWHLSGIDETSAIRSLAAADAMLKKDFAGGMAQLARMKGMTLRQLADSVEGDKPAFLQEPQNNYGNPHLLNLESKVKELEDRLLSEQREKERIAVESSVNELYELRDETDASGRYLRPELHDDEFVRQLVPVVEGLSKTFPNEKPRQLLLRAYTAYTGKPAIPQRVPQDNRVQNAKKASLSVRSSSGGVTSPRAKAIPDSVEETAMQIAREMGLI